MPVWHVPTGIECPSRSFSAVLRTAGDLNDLLWRDAVAMMFHGVTVRVASLEHLIQTKQQADRPQDRADIDRLGAILKLRTSR